MTQCIEQLGFGFLRGKSIRALTPLGTGQDLSPCLGLPRPPGRGGILTLPQTR